MKWENLKDSKVLFFAAGAVALPLVKKLISCPKTRQLAVTGIAKGMKLRQDAEEALKNLREDAEDLCCEAEAEEA